MRPLCLELQNFLVFADARVDFRGLRGLVLLSGEHRGTDAAADSNGAGKSSLVDGIAWALYGRMARPRHRAEDVVRHAAGADCRVRLVFADRDAREIEIVRHRKHSRHKDALFFSIDGSDARGSSSAETQRRIDQLVGMDFETFATSVLYTQHPLRGRFAELSDEQKKQLLDSILGVEALSRARDLAKQALRASQSALGRAELRVQGLRDQAAWLDRQRAEYQGRAESWHRDHASRVAGLERRKEALCAEAEALAAREPAVPRVGSAPEPPEAQLDAATRALERAEAEARRRDGELEQQGSLAQARCETARALVGRLQGELARFQGLGDTCPVCAQAISERAHAAHAERLTDEIAEQARAALDARQSHASIQATRSNARAAWTATRKDREREVGELRAHAEARRLALAQHAAWERERDALCRQERELAAQIESASREENAFVALAEQAETERADRQRELLDVERDLDRLRAELERLRFWDHGFGPRGLKSYLFDSILPLLNERARFYADLLTAGTLSVQFSTTVEKDDGLEDRFTVRVLHRSGADNYNLLSGGERQRVNLIINLALQDLVASRATRALPIAIYDEAFEGLDRTGVEAAVRVLSEAAREKDLVLVVTHQDHLKDLFAHELRVVSERGASVIQPIC